MLFERAAELEADGDMDAVDGEGEWDDDREEGDDEDAAELFGGSEYDAVVRLQERAAANGKAAHLGKRASVKNPKYPKNPKWKGNYAGASSTKASTSTTRALAASTQIIVGSPTASSSKTTTTAKPSSSSSSASKTTTSKTTTSTKLTLPTASSGCPSMYTTTTGGAIYGPQVGTGAAASAFLPVPSTFVVRSKNKLYLDGEEFRIAGPSSSSFFLSTVRQSTEGIICRHLLARTRRER